VVSYFGCVLKFFEILSVDFLRWEIILSNIAVKNIQQDYWC